MAKQASLFACAHAGLGRLTPRNMASILCVRDLRKSYGEHEVVSGV